MFAPSSITPAASADNVRRVKLLPFKSIRPDVNVTALRPNAAAFPIRTSAPSIVVVPAYVFAPFSSTRPPVSDSAPDPWITESITPPDVNSTAAVPAVPRSIVPPVATKVPSVRVWPFTSKVPAVSDSVASKRSVAAISLTEPAPLIVNVPEKAVVSAPNSNTPASAIVRSPSPESVPSREPPATVNELPMSTVIPPLLLIEAIEIEAASAIAKLVPVARFTIVAAFKAACEPCSVTDAVSVRSKMPVNPFRLRSMVTSEMPLKRKVPFPVTFLEKSVTSCISRMELSDPKTTEAFEPRAASLPTSKVPSAIVVMPA